MNVRSFLKLLGLLGLRLSRAPTEPDPHARDRSTESRGGGSKLSKHDLSSTVESKNLASQSFSAFCEARESGICLLYTSDAADE